MTKKLMHKKRYNSSINDPNFETIFTVDGVVTRGTALCGEIVTGKLAFRIDRTTCEKCIELFNMEPDGSKRHKLLKEMGL